jgi:enoyl-CoA hydratase/carnithine racemase
MPEINWDITPGWGGTAKIAKFAGRRKAKEWNLIGAMFSAAVAERHNLVNRLCEPEVLDHEVDALVEVMLAKNPATLQVTKYFLDKGADLDLANSMIFEVAPPRRLERQGIADFVEKGSRDQRRKLVMDFWQD